VKFAGDFEWPQQSVAFWMWVVVSSVAQIGATALLLRVMAERNFALGVAYAKTEVMQVAVVGFVLVGDPITPGMLLAVVFATFGVLLLSPIDRAKPLRTFIKGWTTRSALFGIASGAGFAVAAVGFRGAALALGDSPFPMAAAVTLVAGQAFQTLLLGGWLLAINAEIVVRVLKEWRRSMLAGLMGATASACWFTAFAIQSAAHIRTLALIEILFGYVVSRRIFSEHVSGLEATGMALLCGGLVIVTLWP